MQIFSNNAATTLAAAAAASDTALTIASGSKLPTVTAPDYLMVTLTNGSGTETSWEVLKITAHVSGSTAITAARAQEGTTALAWAVGDKIEARLTATSLLPLEGRVPIADAAYTITNLANVIVALTSLTAGRTITLPSASGRAGQRITIMDESGSCSTSYPITIARAGSDTIDGLSSVAIAIPYGSITIVSNGTGKWTILRSRKRMVTFTASGTWTAPAGVDCVSVIVIGGGGGGSTTYGGVGGQGLIVSRPIAVTPGTAYTITVGAGGTTSSDTGGAGGTSSFGALLSATGGGGTTTSSVSWTYGSATYANAGAYGGGVSQFGMAMSAGESGFCQQFGTGKPGLQNAGMGYGVGGSSAAGQSGVVIIEWVE